MLRSTIIGAAAQGYPVKPLRMLVAFAPGGNVDITARTVAPGLAEWLGQQVLVDNRPGAGGSIATNTAAKAPPDGYTILLASSSVMTNGPALMDPVRGPDVRPCRPGVVGAALHQGRTHPRHRRHHGVARGDPAAGADARRIGCARI